IGYVAECQCYILHGHAVFVIACFHPIIQRTAVPVKATIGSGTDVYIRWCIAYVNPGRSSSFTAVAIAYGQFHFVDSRLGKRMGNGLALIVFVLHAPTEGQLVSVVMVHGSTGR